MQDSVVFAFMFGSPGTVGRVALFDVHSFLVVDTLFEIMSCLIRIKCFRSLVSPT